MARVCSGAIQDYFSVDFYKGFLNQCWWSYFSVNISKNNFG